MLKNETSAKRFFGKHFWPGVAEYHDGDKVSRVLLLEDTIRRMNPTFEGKPVFVKHVDDVITKPLDELKQEVDGWVIRSFYNEVDGNTWVEFLINSQKGLKAIENGWRLSNAYVKTKVNPKKGQWNGVDYDEEILDGEYEHLAIVDNPRYEQSIILTPEQFKEYNEKKKTELNRLSNDKSDLKKPVDAKEKARQMVKKIIKNRLVQNSPVAIALGKWGGRLAQLLKRKGQALKAKTIGKPATGTDFAIVTASTLPAVSLGLSSGVEAKNPYAGDASGMKSYSDTRKKRIANPLTGKVEEKYYKSLDKRHAKYEKMLKEFDRVKGDYDRLYKKYYGANSKKKINKNFNPLSLAIPAAVYGTSKAIGYLTMPKATPEQIKLAKQYRKIEPIHSGVFHGKDSVLEQDLKRYAFLKEWEKAKKLAALKKGKKFNKKNIKNKQNSLTKNGVLSFLGKHAQRVMRRGQAAALKVAHQKDREASKFFRAEKRAADVIKDPGKYYAKNPKVAAELSAVVGPEFRRRRAIQRVLSKTSLNLAKKLGKADEKLGQLMPEKKFKKWDMVATAGLGAAAAGATGYGIYKAVTKSKEPEKPKKIDVKKLEKAKKPEGNPTEQKSEGSKIRKMAGTAADVLALTGLALYGYDVLRNKKDTFKGLTRNDKKANMKNLKNKKNSKKLKKNALNSLTKNDQRRVAIITNGILSGLATLAGKAAQTGKSKIETFIDAGSKLKKAMGEVAKKARESERISIDPQTAEFYRALRKLGKEGEVIYSKVHKKTAEILAPKAKKLKEFDLATKKFKSNPKVRKIIDPAVTAGLGAGAAGLAAHKIYTTVKEHSGTKTAK